MVAIKSPAPSVQTVSAHLSALRREVPPEFSLGYSGDWHSTEALLAGGDAWYSVAAGVFPNVCGAIVRAVENGNADEARRLDAVLQPLWALFQELSSLRVVYAAVAALGICQAEPPRPILPLPEPAQRRVAETLKSLNLS